MILSDDDKIHDNDGDIDSDIDGDGNQVSSSTPSSSMLPLICRGEKLIRGESTDTLMIRMIMMLMILSSSTLTMMMILKMLPEATRNCFEDFDSGTGRDKKGRQQRLGYDDDDDYIGDVDNDDNTYQYFQPIQEQTPSSPPQDSNLPS